MTRVIYYDFICCINSSGDKSQQSNLVCLAVGDELTKMWIIAVFRVYQVYLSAHPIKAQPKKDE